MLFIFIRGRKPKPREIRYQQKQLTNESTAVLYGKCTGKRCEWNENKSIIYTYVTVAPEEYIKGNLGSEAVIAVTGGEGR